MSFLKKNANLVAVAVFVVIVAFVIILNLAAGGYTFEGKFWALIPPFVAIALALITKEVYFSLFAGVLLGAIMASGVSFSGTLDILVVDGLTEAVAGNAGIYVFLVLLGIIVAIVNKAGASRAFGEWAQSHIKTRVGAALATFLLGVLIFIDDYFNCLTVGSVMTPVTDSHKISRVKLAYLIDATAAPVCMIAPVSSWAAAVSSNVPEGTPYSGIDLFVRAIPYNFYSLFTLVFIVAITLMSFDYGKMASFEIKAQNGDLSVDNNTEEKNNDYDGSKIAAPSKGKVYDLILPIAVLIVASVIGLLYVGGFFGTDAWGGTDYKWDFVGAFGNTDAFIGLPWGGIIALIIILVYMVVRKIVTFAESMECIKQGFVAMVPAITILTLANSLKTMTGLLDATAFVEGIMQNAGAITWLLPAVVFALACVISFATGTSWGTFGILIPIVSAVFMSTNENLFFVGISACLAGAVCGDHCSPISDTTIMASAGAQCNHINHVETQLPYAITVAAVSFVTYLLAGLFSLFMTPIISLPIGAALLVAVLYVIKKKTQNGAVKAEE